MLETCLQLDTFAQSSAKSVSELSAFSTCWLRNCSEEDMIILLELSMARK